jgi:hypothetical protein
MCWHGEVDGAKRNAQNGQNGECNLLHDFLPDIPAPASSDFC